MDDRRAQGGGGRALSGGLLQLPLLLFSKFGVPGLVAGGVLLYMTGAFDGGPAPSSPAASGTASGETGDAAEDELVQFVSFVLDDVQATWKGLIEGYRPARLVIFRGQTRSGCGVGQAAMGPFYCSRDERAYIDLSFYEELRRRFGAPGDFAQAYVMAHEIGHHMQHLMGTSERVHAAPRDQQLGPEGLSVRLELQADCYAGVWAAAAAERDLLEVGDVEEALRAAAAIGDDQIQKQAGGAVAPESWSHGSSEQRMRWFRAGMQGGTPAACDTFRVETP